MSAQDDYVTHVGRRYRMNAPAAEKIRYHQDRIKILQRYAAEVPSESKWAAAEIESSRSFITKLRRGDL